MSKHKLYVPLLGGLGNQLFQLSAALSNANKREIVLTSNLGHQRRNSDNQPELEGLTLPRHVKIGAESREHKLCTFFLNRLLVGKQENKLFRYLLFILGTSVLSIHFRQFIRIHASEGVGFSEWQTRSSTEIGIGYFQSYKWTEAVEIRNLMQQLNPRETSNRFAELKDQISSQESLVMHIRLGDYLNEPGIGALDANYYLRALEEFQGDFETIWVFSDQPAEAEKLLPVEVVEKCIFVQPSELTTIETWELMRYGRRYIISNSTFSWWSARLSHTDEPIVIAPSPWFADLPAPKLIIPLEWKEISR
jgi:hypothetical protein